MNKSISTIIPFYNCKNLLSTMLDSILSGTFLPCEIILIDDGSSDDSCSIAKKYAKDYSFIKYYHQDHKGVSSARNLGLHLSTGYWISFLDADDYIEPNMYESMINTIIDDTYDGCICGYYTHKDNVVTPYGKGAADDMSSQEMLKGMFTDDNIRGFLWSRLFKAEIIKKYSFDEDISVCEDLLFQTQIFSKEQLKFSYCPYPLYHYVQQSSSATSVMELFKNGSFIYEPAFKRIKNIVDESYISSSYDSILKFQMYCLLKQLRRGDKHILSQIRQLQKLLQKNKSEDKSFSRFAYCHAPVLYSFYLRF